MHGAKLTTVNYEYDHKRRSFHSDGSRSAARRKESTDHARPTEAVTSLMISCQQELEHDIHTILLKKVSNLMFVLAFLIWQIVER